MPVGYKKLTHGRSYVMKFILCLFLLLILNGCATSTQAQKEFKNAHKEMLKITKEFQACYTKISRNNKYHVLFNHLAIKGEKADIRLLSSDKEFTKEDKNLFLDFYAEHQACDQNKLNHYGKIDGNLQLLFIKQQQVRDKTFLSWIEAPYITYGHLNKDLENLREEERKQNSNWGNNYAQQLDYQHKSELARKQKKIEQSRTYTDSIMQEIIDGLIALGKIQSSLSAQQTVVIEHQIQPITPNIINTSCRKGFNGTIHCTSF